MSLQANQVWRKSYQPPVAIRLAMASRVEVCLGYAYLAIQSLDSSYRPAFQERMYTKRGIGQSPT